MACEYNAGGNPAMDQHPIQGGVEILLIMVTLQVEGGIDSNLMGLTGLKCKLYLYI